jgi:ABC-type Fe3+-hydroxamate transport system substrate-binding protein
VWFRNKKRIGGTKNVDIDKVKSLEPDLIIANKEENTKEQIEELATLFPVWISDIKTIEDGLIMIGEVGKLVDRTAEAEGLVKEIKAGFEGLKKDGIAKRVAYFIWRNPWMVAGGDTFINNMLEAKGWVNVFADRPRYPEINLENLASLAPELILLSSEPYPFKEKHIAEIIAVLPEAKVLLVDGEMFSWYGSRMKKAAGYLRGFTNEFKLQFLNS